MQFKPRRDLLVLMLPSPASSSQEIPLLTGKPNIFFCACHRGYQSILVQWPGIAHQDEILCSREQSYEYYIFRKYPSLSLSQKLFLINIKGNYATGVREFGILIDQAGFQLVYYWCARADLFFLIQSYPKVLGTPGTGVTLSVGLRALSQSLAT